MNRINFCSNMASCMNDFVRFKQQAGYNYRGQAVTLRYFDRFLLQNQLASSILTREIVEAYIISLEQQDIAPATRSSRLSAIKEFSAYQGMFNKESYTILKNPIRYQAPLSSYIYSEEETSRILEAFQTYPSRKAFRNLCYYTITGLLQFTGLRIQECLNLRLKDWNPEHLSLFVEKGKFKKDRLIPVSRTVADKIEDYLALRLKYGLTIPNDPLFINGKNKKVFYRSFYEVFSAVLGICGIDGSSQPFSRKPCIHALRHSFAVRNIIRWVKEGKDVNILLPYLSTYLGHKGIESTQVYLQSTRELMQYGADKFHQNFKNNI